MKLPVASDLRSRDGDTGQDQRLLNAYVDVKRGIQFVNKRPSLEAALELPVGTGSFSTLGQALYVWQEVDVDSTNLTTSVVGIRGDKGKKAPDTKALLYFTTQPSNGSRNTAISPSIVVTARDKFGNTKTDFTGNVTLSFATNRYAATLSGTLTVAAVAGVATFSNVQINRSGIGFALRATATGAKPATSNTFDIQTVLAFTSLPTSVNVDETFTVVVASKDQSGNTDTNYTGDITLILIPTEEASVLSGTLTRTAVAGVATFTGLSISVPETYGFVASGTTIPLVCRPTSAASNLFNVVQNGTLVFDTIDETQQAGAILNINSPDVIVYLQDATPEIITSFTGNVTITIGTNPASGTLGGTTTVAAVAGVATFIDLTIDNIGNGYTLLANATDQTQGESNAFNVKENHIVSGQFVEAISGGTRTYTGKYLTYGSSQYFPISDESLVLFFTVVEEPIVVNKTVLHMTGTLTQDFFESITINGFTLLSGDATFTAGATSIWEWDGENAITANSTYYPFTIVYP